MRLEANRHDGGCCGCRGSDGCCDTSVEKGNSDVTAATWRGSVLTGKEPPTPLWGVESCSFPTIWPAQSQLSQRMRSRHHISMEHRLRRKQLNSDTDAKKHLKLNSDTNASKKYIWKEEEKRRNTCFRKIQKKKEKRPALFQLQRFFQLLNPNV